jgi:hypothetical protein
LGCGADVSEERTVSIFGNDVEDENPHVRIFGFIDRNGGNKYAAEIYIEKYGVKL